MNVGEILGNAVNTLFSKLGKAILSVLAYLVIGFALGLLNVIPLVGAIVMYILMVPIQLGFVKQFIKIYKGEEVKAFDFLNLGFEKFGMAWRVTGRLILKYLGAIIIMAVAYIIMGAGLATGSMGILGMSSDVVAAGGVAAIIGLILIIVSAIWSIVLSLKYAFAYNELAYNENANTGKEIVETTAQVMNGNKGKFVGLYVVLFVIGLLLSLLMSIPVLGLIIAIIVLILIAPFMQFVMVIFYDSARNEKMPNAESVQAVEYNNDNDSQNPIQM